MNRDRFIIVSVSAGGSSRKLKKFSAAAQISILSKDIAKIYKS